MRIRAAESRDVPALLEIVNAEIREGTANWALEEDTHDRRSAWLRARQDGGYPVIVVEDANRILGYAASGPFRALAGWNPSCEHSIYLRSEAQGRGIGRMLMEALLEALANAGFRNTIACIDATNAGSIAFHERFGFERVGFMRGVGKKFGRELDAVFLQLRLFAH